MAWTKHLLRASVAGALLVAATLAVAARSLAPLPQEEAISTHGPFEMGECAICHDPKDKKSPGRLLKAGSELCFDCHEDFKGTVSNHPKVNHQATKCTACHSPHNAKKRKLML